MTEDVQVLTERLALHCNKAGLKAEVLAPTRVRISDPDGNGRQQKSSAACPIRKRKGLCGGGAGMSPFVRRTKFLVR
jgi:hypothetical protein